MEKEKKVGEKKHYKNPILYLRKSKAGEHLYAFNVETDGGEDTVLGNNIESLLMNISDVRAVMAGEMDWAKVSVLSAEASE